MAHKPEMDDDEDDWEETPARPRRNGPRFGPLLTIAVAILMLFGAASRLGKPQNGDGLFSFDLSAKSALDKERLRSEEERMRTIVTIGAVPTTADSLRPPTPGARIDPHALPPVRGDFDLDLYSRERNTTAQAGTALPLPPQLAASVPVSGQTMVENDGRSSRFDPAPEAQPSAGPSVAGQTYTVQTGDNWMKIATKTGKRWQDVQKANPGSVNGLRVGMKLKLP